MKLVYTTTYDVEQMTVRNFLADHRYRRFILNKGDIPSYAGQNLAYLAALNQARKLYVVNDSTETTKVIR